MSSYSIQALPWRNLLSISLFPEIRHEKLSRYTDLVDHVIPIVKAFNIIPSPVSPIKILVIHPTDNHRMDRITKIIIKLTKIATADNKVISHENFFLATTNVLATNSKNVEMHDNIIFIGKLSLIQLCRRNVQVYLNFIFVTATALHPLRPLNFRQRRVIRPQS